jgi:hypothetical protein
VSGLQPAVPLDPKRRAAFYPTLPFPGTLRQGSKGIEVEAVQWALTRAGFRTYVDGIFGPVTERTVKQFQTAKKLTVDGVVGPVTWAALGLRKDPPKPTPQRGAKAAATAAYGAGFHNRNDLIAITKIAGRESGWRSDAVNPNTSDRGMWQINWTNLQREPYRDLRTRLKITTDTDLLDLGKNAAVAYQFYRDSVAQGQPWLPWRGSETGADGSGPGWDPNGSHLWRTEPFAAEATAAADAVLASVAPPPAPSVKPMPSVYTVKSSDSDGFIALVGRCVGIGSAPWSLRLSAAEAVAAYNGVPLNKMWRVGDSVRFPPTIKGVRAYTVKSGDTLATVTKGLGLGTGAPAQQRTKAINAWQGATPKPGNTWYGGPA